jgi:cation transporter-like permease
MDKNTAHTKHWRYLYERRRRRINALGISAKQMAWSQVFSLVGSIVAGVLLESNKTTLALLAGAFVILPGIFDLDGSLGAVLSAKINHRMENLEARVWRVFIGSTAFALLVAILAGFIVAGVGATLATIFFNAHFRDVFLAGFGAIVLSAAIGFPIIGALSVFFRKRNMNPDDVVGPIESSVFDILTVITLTVMVKWIL